MAEVRVGIVRFEDRMYAWQAKVIDEVRAVPGVLVVAMLTCPHNKTTGYAPPRHSVSFKRAAAVIGSEMICPLDTAAAQSLCLDIIINLTRSEIPADLPGGSWRLSFASRRAPGRFEIRKGMPVSHIVLKDERTDNCFGHVCFKTARNWRRNCDQITLGTTFLIARALRVLAVGLPGPHAHAPPAAAEQPWPLRIISRISRAIEKRAHRSKWTIGFASTSIGELIKRQTLADIVWLNGLPEDRFFADPFPLSRSENIVTILAENGDSGPPYKGHISEISFNMSGQVKRLRDAIATPEHMSFPFLFKLGGKNYCLPECHESGNLQLFAGEARGWRRDFILLEGLAAVDPVVHRHGGKWWLFCCDSAHDDITHLFLFYADKLTGPWTQHPLNPVKSDVRSSRPAGAIVEVDGVLYRPAQDCSRRYGGSLSMQRINRLSETDFAEDTAFKLDPKAFGGRYIGLHTLNSLGNIIVIDALERRSVFWR
ncbi:MAG: hypothetical protein AB7O04_09145 [Hyphomonadaceae bacterium]